MGLLSSVVDAFSLPDARVLDQLKADETITLPPISGDVAQVSNLPLGIAQAFGINLDSDTVTRKEAMTIPAMRRGRQVIAGTLGTAPLICVRRRAGNSPERIERNLLKQPDPNVTRSFQLTWTIDDLLFYGVSWWQVTARDIDNKPAFASRIAPHRLSYDHFRRKILVDGKPVEDFNLIRFDGPDEGVLTHGATTLRTCLLLEAAVRRYARMDVPLGLIEDEGGQLTDTEIQALLDSWEAARLARTTGYLPAGLKYQSAVFNAQQMQLTEARQHQAGEVARLLNLPPNAVNAPSNDSLTYATTESNRRELTDITFAPFISAVEQRLSMNDVTPNGTEVYFDLSKFVRGDLNQVLSSAKTAIDAGIMTVDEIRTEWLQLPPLGNSNE